MQRKHASLDGIGASKEGGRWNSPGVRVVYTASCGALAALEYRLHARELPTDMVLLTIEVPDSIGHEVLDSLPGEESAFRHLGDQWISNGRTAVMNVPSVAVPKQWNLLINPAHPDAATIGITEQTPFAYDSRLFA